ncbi:MAG: hypothetical protein BGO41_03475 [Clostridiales bacterium 38-18]|nr:MAG: hypothetical protein BGO41_03475 [Clostridiales bacterium 38-18]
MSYQIVRPQRDDQEAMNDLIIRVLKDNWTRNQLDDLEDDLKDEIKTKLRFVSEDLLGILGARYFIVAKEGDKIVGIAEHGPANDTIRSCNSEELNALQEVGTVFVLPEYQGKGVGKALMSAMQNRLSNIGESFFCIDSGYKTAQGVWIHLYGEPTFLLRDYWGQGIDHMVWMVKLK